MKKQSKKTRREFLSSGLKAGAMMPLIGTNIFPFNIQKTNHPLKILILGGTSFLGPHQIAYAINRGHSITTFTRGKTTPTIHEKLFSQVEQLIGDRENNLEALKGRKWDAVIDNSGQRVHWTKATAELLQDNVNLYLYTSSTGVYYPYLGSDIKEDTNLVLEMPEVMDEIQKMEYGYGVMKANSEIEVLKGFGEKRSIIVRPTYMMGPGDRTDRFTYWPVRLSRGGEVMVPGKKEDPVQYIDVRDVANWMIRLIENQTTGTFNAVGPSSATQLQAFIYGAHAAFSSPASFEFIPDYKFLKSKDVFYAVPWIMPEGNDYGSARANNQKAIANGLSFTPLADSVRDIFAWWNSDAVGEERRKKMVSGEGALMAKEQEILKAWKMKKG